ncbi:MAG TPA: alpha/beta hydrolase [Conexibacter sp.]|nr:alpha/beta hydrolase [Conexibacter sp.]
MSASAEPQAPVPSEQARAYIDAVGPSAPMWEREIQDLRAQMREAARRFGGEPEPIASVAEVDAGGVPARLYRPTGAERGAYVWLHGGSWMIGDPGCFETMARAIANRAGCAVLSVDYRRAPEHRYPAATDDAWSAVRWAADHFERVAVGGDSAGGNLAAACALRARDAELELALQLLVYPVLDPDLHAPYREEFVTRYAAFLGEQAGYVEQARASLEYIWDVYVPDPAQRLQADAAPMRAASLTGVAPAVVVVAEHDMLRPESERYARRLDAAGVPVELWPYPGQVHGFVNLLGAMPDARDLADRSAAALRLAFAD